MPKLIGITGPSGSGKDTLGNILYHYHGYTCMSFAGPLKQAAAEVFHDHFQNFYTQEGKSEISPYWNVTRRKLLQDFGETMCQQFGEDFWVRRWFRDYFPISETDNIVVTDVRKDVEADFIRGLGGIIVVLRRPGAGLSGEEGAHKTEQGITIHPQDIVICNYGSIDDLKRQANNLVDHIHYNDLDQGRTFSKEKHDS